MSEKVVTPCASRHVYVIGRTRLFDDNDSFCGNNGEIVGKLYRIPIRCDDITESVEMAEYPL